MKRIWFLRIAVITVLLSLQVTLVPSMWAEPATFNDPNMQIVWERTDKPVEMFVTARSYMWGPNTLLGSPSVEPYVNSPGGQRTVQYFDKSRMEVNNPNGDRSKLFFITNGLLVREMVSGNRQFGDQTFQFFPPSQEAVAGDPAPVNPDSPTYSSFRNIASLNNNNPSPNRVGQSVIEAIDKAGNIFNVVSPDPSVYYVFFDPNLKHNIPNRMFDFLNQTGPVFVNGQILQQQVIDPTFLAGFPITEAYWTTALVGGVAKDVLVQLYERRVLTYTPSNPPGFQVEMGNVGQHYFRWRYGGPVAQERIVYDSDWTGDFHIFTMNPDGSDVRQLTSVGQNSQPRWSPDNQRIVFVSGRDGNSEIYVMNADGSNQTRLTNTAADTEELPDWSADGTRIFFVLGGAGTADIWSMAADGGDLRQLTFNPSVDTHPRASPDGNKVAFASWRDGNFEVYTMNVDGSNQARLAFRPGTSDFPTDWKGNKILFNSDTVSTFQIWSMNADGSSQTLLVGDKDTGASFSPDMQRIVFCESVYVGFMDTNIFVENIDGTNRNNLTDVTAVDYEFADWSN